MATSERAVAGGAVTSAAFVGVDNEIAQTWKQVEERVIQMAGGDLSKINPGLGIESVLRHLDDAAAKDKKASEKYGTIKTIFNRTLQCIQTVGGIVADGASYVFQPAGTCYNALTFVIQAWQGYEGIFESLATLLNKCTEFLDRLTYYSQYGMDSKLTKVACQHLQFFVEICDCTLKLKSKRHKFAAFMKQMFLNDDGVQELLSRMEGLVDKERGLVAAQTWKTSNEAATNSRDGLSLTRKVHNTLVEDKNQLKREKELQKWKLSIVDALECDRSVLDDTPEPWEKAWKRHKSDILEGTGDWLVQDPQFKSWVMGPNAKPILGLEGGDGSGKTLLASNVILHLRKLRSIEPAGSRVVVAHNFIESDSKTTSSLEDLNSMSRSLMCQLALGDEPFMKSVAGICEKSKDFSGPLHMWTQLLLENEDRANIDVIFFLVLDGLGENIALFTQLLQRFSDSPFLHRTRILLTGQQGMFSSLEKTGLTIDKIMLGEKNKMDQELYIVNRMDNMEILKDTSRPGVTEMREKILKDLLESTGGDYYKINRVLDNISKTDEVEEIDEYLKNAGNARLDQIEADIEKLNETRTPKEISEINEIILWINTGREWLSPEQLEAALALKAGTGSMGQRTSLMSLASKIRSKYTLFGLDYGIVDYKVGEIREKVPLKKRDGNDETSSSGFKEIQPSEITILKHYLSTVCPRDLYEKMGFEEFFNLKLVRKGNYICQDPDNAHLNIAMRCMACLIEERTDKTKELHAYSMNQLLYHLTETDLSLADRDLKAEAGRMLVRLFTEDYAIDSLFNLRRTDEFGDRDELTREGMPEGWKIWLFSVEGVNELAKWFKDSAVIEKVKDNTLVKDLNAASDSSGDRFRVLYDFACKKAARELFRGESMRRETLEAFTFILAALKAGDPPNDDVFTPTLEMVQVVEDWSQKALGITDKDSRWESQAASLLGHLSWETIPKTEAETRARKALELDPKNYSAFYTLSRVLESGEEAKSILKDSIEQLMSDTEWRQDTQHQALLARMIISLGDRYWESEDTQEQAIVTWSKILDVTRSYSIVKDFAGILTTYTTAKRWDAILSFFETLAEDIDGEPNPAGVFINKQGWEDGDTFRSTLSQACLVTNRLDFLDSLYGKAISNKPVPFELYVIRFNYGRSLMEFEGHEEAGALMWESALELLPEERKPMGHMALAMGTVPIYMKLAAAKGEDSPGAEAYYEKIETMHKVWETSGLRSTETRVAFAQYFKSRGEDRKAKEVLKPCVTECLEMLQDDDIENDAASFWDLNQIFATMHDITNDLVAWEMMSQSKLASFAEYERKLEVYERKTEEKKKEAEVEKGSENDGQPKSIGNSDASPPSTEESDEEILIEPSMPSTVIAFCDGGCGQKFKFASEVWTCLTESGQVQLDNECYRKLQEGTLDTKVCDKSHKHYYIGKRHEERLGAVPKGSVLVGDRVVTLEAWKEEIRAQYVNFS
ncbi:Fc.00g093910.m01.CDS01 [Cosmosporella sp. VM-42]